MSDFSQIELSVKISSGRANSNASEVLNGKKTRPSQEFVTAKIVTTTASENSPASFTHSNSEAGTSPPFEDSEASQIIRVKTALASARQILVISGAGISAESDIPTFRSKGGWWKSHDPQKLATRAAFERNPREVWEWYDY